MIRPAPLPLLIVAMLPLMSVTAHAQLARTFVSAAGGNDANDCNRLTPCRTFQAAHNQTLANGEITVLDPGGYGAVTITKTLSIINDGVGEAGVLVSGGAIGITISAGASDVVSLRGLTVKGIGFGGGAGIVLDSGKSLTVENCVLRNLTGNGVTFRPLNAGRLLVSNTFVADNGGDGIAVTSRSPGAVSAVFNRVETHNNAAHGIVIDSRFGGKVDAVIANSLVSGSATAGFAAFAGTTAASLTVVRSTATGNGTGIAGLFGANVRVGRSTMTGNFNPWGVASGAVLVSYGDNNIDGNINHNIAPATIAKK